ncbi:methylmalonyl-CoA mutase subunit beta [Mesoflavibacter zeaxanthinifaciens]|uniref:methylmalonyl-CoA mutase subunit beta n=1 Tax=Mesoflavibacter zeaxanthinifaciens TaxID=393060 RepID=UPI0026F24602|nr:methylmalonyl-CoA mutase subunit beta [Mesoflavibacter zeaxanthinifaciens]
MSKKLFSDFEPVSAKAWKQKIQVDLKGADYNDTLVWQTNDGINVKPFYHQDTLENTLYIKPQTWSIGQIIFAQNADAANKKAINAIEKGAETIKFIIPNNKVSISELINNIDLHATNIQLELLFLDQNWISNIDQNISIQVDPIHQLVKTGNWFSNLDKDLAAIKDTVAHTGCLTIDTTTYQNGGANNVQQIAYTILHANEYFNIVDVSTIKKVIFNVAVGTNYFFEIAKLRALRALFDSIASEYNISATCVINAIPSKRNKTIYDYNTNMLRTTTECMSAVLGGANTVFNLPYDAIYHKDNAFGERIARNQLLVLKNESYFNAVNNPSDGSYYIESLTNQLAENSLDLFKDIEANGGLLKQLKEGTIQKKIKESAAKEQQQFDEQKIILLGTNKHPNKEDKMKNDLELFPFVKTNPVKTLIEPIIEKRLAEKLEQERLKTEE